MAIAQSPNLSMPTHLYYLSMNLFMQKAITTLILLVYWASAFAYVVKGKVIDAAGKPIQHAIVAGRNAVDEVVFEIQTNQTGLFTSSEVNDSTLSIAISKDTFETVKIDVMGTSNLFVDLGTITLFERQVTLGDVVVTGQSVMHKPGRYIIIPSRKELEQSANGLSLLNALQHKLPGLTVNEVLQTVQVDNATPVFKVNGKLCELSKVLSLNPKSVLRIEYSDTPDLRYDGRSVINIILNPQQNGGSVMANVLAGVTTGFLNGNVGIDYHHGKSEWELNYAANWRDYDKREISSRGAFIGRDTPVERERIGLPGDFNYLSNELSVAYTYTHSPNTLFATRVGLGFEDQKISENSLNVQRYKSDISRYENHTRWKLGFVSPNFDLFFRKQIDKSQYLEANVYGRRSSGNYDRDYLNVHANPLKNDTLISATDNKSWRIGTDIMYAKTFKSLMTSVGIQDYYNATDNVQVENGRLNRVTIDQNRLTAYTQIVGRAGQLNYGLNVSAIYNHANNNAYKTNALRIKVNVNANYAFSPNWSLNYLLMLNPSLPSISQQSELIQVIDDISIRQGNPDLKPATYLRNRLYLRFAKGKFSSTLWASHSRTHNPIYYMYSYIGDASNPYYNMFLSKAINGRATDQLNLELEVSAQELFGFVTLWGNVGWDNSRVQMPLANHTRRRFYGSLRGTMYFGNWVISANYEVEPKFELAGNTYHSSERWNNVKVQYHCKNWYFSITAANLFTHRGAKYERITVSDVHPEHHIQSIRDNANMVLLGATYRLNYGKGKDKAKRTLNNGGLEKGVDVFY